MKSFGTVPHISRRLREDYAEATSPGADAEEDAVARDEQIGDDWSRFFRGCLSSAPLLSSVRYSCITGSLTHAPSFISELRGPRLPDSGPKVGRRAVRKTKACPICRCVPQASSADVMTRTFEALISFSIAAELSSLSHSNVGCVANEASRLQGSLDTPGFACCETEAFGESDRAARCRRIEILKFIVSATPVTDRSWTWRARFLICSLPYSDGSTLSPTNVSIDFSYDSPSLTTALCLSSKAIMRPTVSKIIELMAPPCWDYARCVE
nr:hypothetical protein CFP56_62697 [Quercus suber]